jgi:WD40 repeat protein
MAAVRQIRTRARMAWPVLGVLLLLVASTSWCANNNATIIPSREAFCLSASPDGKLLAAGYFKQARVWHLGKKRLVLVFPVPRGAVRSITFSPDGHTLAGACDNGAIYLWETATGKLRHTLGGQTEVLFTAVSYAPDGKTLASAGSVWVDDEVKLWDLTTGKERCTLPLRKRGLHGLAFSPDGGTLALAVSWGLGPQKTSGGIALWDVRAGKEKPGLVTAPGHPLVVAFSPDGKQLAGGGRRWVTSHSPHALCQDVWVWDAAGKLQWMASGEVDSCRALAFSGDGKILATGGAVRKGLNGSSTMFAETTLWAAATGKVLRKLEGGTGHVHALAFALRGSRLAIVGGGFRLYDPSSGAALQQFQVPDDQFQEW